MKDLDALSPAVDSMTESSTHSSSDEDSSSKHDAHQMLGASKPDSGIGDRDSPVPNASPLVLEEEPSGEQLAEPAPVDTPPVDVESLTVDDQKQDEAPPAISFDTATPMLTCQVTSASLAPDVEVVESSVHASLHHTSRALSRQTSAGSVCSHHVSI